MMPTSQMISLAMVPSWWPTVSSGVPVDVLAQRRRPVDRLLKDPFDRAGDDPRRDEDQDGDEDLRAPVHHLGLPIGALVDLIHVACSLVRRGAVNPPRRPFVAALCAAASQ